MTNHSIRKIKGLVLSFPFVTLYTYINLDNFDNKLNINIVNMSFLGVFLTLMWVIIIVAYMGLKKSPEQKNIIPSKFSAAMTCTSILHIILFIFTMTGLSHEKNIDVSPIIVSLTSLILYVVILVITYRYKLINILFYSTLITSLFVIAEFNIPKLALIISYVLIYSLALAIATKNIWRFIINKDETNNSSKL